MKEKPIPPAASECCESQCEPCVWDIYFEELTAWKADQKAHKETKNNSDIKSQVSQDKPMPEQAPVIYTTKIKPEWLDYNNHMNVAYYVLIFDEAGVELVTELGLSEEYTRQTDISWMVLENHITYNSEVVLDQEVQITCQIVDHDKKRLHLYFEMLADDGNNGVYLASTLEQMAMCVDLKARKSREFPEEVASNIGVMVEQQNELQRPENIGRTIGIKRR